MSLIAHDTGPTEVLLSLAEEYWQLIRDGVKPYEYRRMYRRDRTRAFIVTTGPTSGLVGYLEFGEPIIRPPQEIAALAESIRPGNGASVLAYLSDRPSGFAIPIDRVFVGPRVSIGKLRRDVGPVPVPQSYVLVQRNAALARFLHSWMTECRRLEL
jgi:predicted transcriptional regulator